MFVLTVDQRHSRRGHDRVDALLAELDRLSPDLVRPFERTAGDEVQAVAARSDVVVDLTLFLVAGSEWSVGIGVGRVSEPLPASTRAGSGPAFAHARAAVTAAKARPTLLAVAGDKEPAVRRAEAALDLVAAVLQRRTERGNEAVALARDGLSQLDSARRLGVTKQAVSQRLQAADWHLELPGRDLAGYLLAEADGRVGGS